jgi:hypothetical protein
MRAKSNADWRPTGNVWANGAFDRSKLGRTNQGHVPWNLHRENSLIGKLHKLLDAFRDALLLGAVKLAVDELMAPALDPGRGRTKIGYLWAIARDDRASERHRSVRPLPTPTLGQKKQGFVAIPPGPPGTRGYPLGYSAASQSTEHPLRESPKDGRWRQFAV